MSIQKQQLKNKVQNLSEIAGSGTQLVSVYIPSDQSVLDQVQRLKNEYSEAENIKSKQTRKRVQGALNKLIGILKQYRKTPDNGIAAFAGYIPERDEYVTEVFDQFPDPITDSKYHCDKQFYTDPLEKILSSDGEYILIILDKNDAVVGEVVGTSTKMVDSFSSLVPGKTQKGGFCVTPETEIILSNGSKAPIKSIGVGDKITGMNFRSEQSITTRVINKWSNRKKTYKVQTENRELTASGDHIVFTSGYRNICQKQVKALDEDDSLLMYTPNSNISETELSEEQITSIYLMEKEKHVIDIETECHNFVANNLVIHNSQQRFERLREEAKENFFKEISNAINNRYVDKRHDIDGIFIGAPEPTRTEFLDSQHLHHELRDKIISETSISTTTEAGLRQLFKESQDVIQNKEISKQKNTVENIFKGISSDETYVAYGYSAVKTAFEFGAVDTVVVSESIPSKTRDEFTKDDLEYDSILEYINESAQEYGSDIQFVSSAFDEGERFRKAFGGIAAILRYPIN